MEMSMSRIESMLALKLNALSTVSLAEGRSRPLVLVVADGQALFDDAATVCEFLDLEIQRVAGDDDLSGILGTRKPMAVVAELDGVEQDGCYVLMTVASHDRDLPVLMVADEEPAMLGAVDAVEELWGLTAVEKVTPRPKLACVVDFVFRAGQRAAITQLMPI
jgi:hypothetical protein